MSRSHSPTLSAGSSSSSNLLAMQYNDEEQLQRQPRDSVNHPGITATSSSKGKERAIDSHYARHPACNGCGDASHPHPHPSRRPSPLLLTSSTSSPWSIESFIHLTRRAARQLTPFSSSSPSTSLSDSSGYLPLYSAAGKQRTSAEVYLEKDDGSLSDGSSNGSSSSNSNEKCACKQKRNAHSYHNDQHYHPPSSLRSTCCLSSSSSSHPCSPTSASSSAAGGGLGGGNNRRFFSTHLCVLVKLAILALALLGVATIVGLATGLVQRTPIYTEKALQDAGWARRPITLSRKNAAESYHGAQQSFAKDPYTGVTLHDFSPASPLYALPGTSPASSSASSSSSSSTSTLSSSSSQSNSIIGNTPVASDSLHLLILCPLRNSAPDLPHLFEVLDSLTHPKSNTSLGFLVGDEDDDTGDVLHRLVQDRTNADDDKRYRHISMLHKDFNLQVPNGANRHSYPVQLQRRSVMARARTYLLTATLEPTVDWVLWVDSDIAEMSPTLFQDLLLYGKAGVLDASSTTTAGTIKSDKQGRAAINDDNQWNDVIVPNAMRRLPDGNLLGFDMNNWSETEESLKLKADMPSDHLLIEGNIWQHMHRVHLADQYTPYTTAQAVSLSSSSSSSSPLPPSDTKFSSTSGQGVDTSSSSAGQAIKFKDQPEIFSSDPRYIASLPPTDQRLNASSPAYIGRLEPLDGIGGVAALVRAEVHRMGAIFPSWIFENQLETEAFGVLAKRLGARVVGLPNLFVLHP